MIKRLQHLVEYGIIKGIEAIVTLPPLVLAIAIGERISAGLRYILTRRDRLIVSNIAASFPEKRPEEVRAIADKVWRNLGRVAVEFIRAREIVPEPLNDAHDVRNFDVLREAFSENRGVIIVAGHYCNWELNGILIHRLIKSIGRQFTAIARPMRNPLADSWVQSRRAAGGIPIILHRDAVRSSLRTLRNGDALGVLIDQNLYTGGIFVDFFGRPAATTSLPALLHGRTGAPVILTHVRRDGTRFEIFFERVAFSNTHDKEKLAIWTEEINERLEAVIRERPEWWFWIHDRWKRSAESAVARPPARNAS